MNEEIDEKIRTELGRVPTDLPESYEKRISETLEQLVEKPMRRRFSYKKAAAALLIFLFVGSTTAYAGVKLYQARLSSMSTDERKQIIQDAQKSTANADLYSRKITAEEKKRYDILSKQYESGTFPTGQIEKVDKQENVEKNKLQYCIENQTFYLPQAALTDEQILEIIDFNYKSDYAFRNQIKETPEPINEKLDKKTAIERSNSLVSDIYGWKVNTTNVTFDTTKNSAGEKLSSFYVDYKGVNKAYNIQTEINANDGMVNGVKLEKIQSDFLVDCKFNAKDKQIDKVGELERVSDILTNKKKVVDKIDVIYRTKNKTTLYRGNYKYLLSFKDGSGYAYLYDYKQDVIYEVYYVPDIKLFDQQEKRNKKMDKQSGVEYFREKIK